MASYPGAPTLGKLQQIITSVASSVGYDINTLPAFASWLTSVPAAYLSNGIGGATQNAGGTGYTATVFTVPLPVTAPSNSVAATVTCTNTGGVLSAPVVATAGSGYGTSSLTFTLNVGSGSGASITVSPANVDQAYNFSPSQTATLQSVIAPAFIALGLLLNGTLQSGPGMATISVHGSGGTGYVVSDVITVTQAGLLGATAEVIAVTSGAVTSLTIATPGFGAQVATALPTTGGSGTGLQVNIGAVFGLTESGTGYNFAAAIQAWTGFLGGF